jgi:hypothetical protein
MTASPPPEPASRRPLGFDDFIGILVAFLTIGTLLFWSIGRKHQGVNLPGLLAPVASPTATATPVIGTIAPETTKPSAAIAPETVPQPSPTSKVISLTPNTLPANPSVDQQPKVDRSQTGVVPVPVPTLASPSISVSPAATSAASPPPVQTASFSDVPSNFWATPFIAALAERNIVSGFQEGTFKPNQPVTRAEFASMLQAAFQQSPDLRAATQFQDISASYWAAQAIEKSYKTGFLQGYPNSVFQPQQQIPRVQALAALARGLQLTAPANAPGILQTYEDANQIPNYAIDKIAAATEAGLVVNYPNAADLEPNRRATRAEVAAFVYQAMVQAGLAQPIESQYVVRP